MDQAAWAIVLLFASAAVSWLLMKPIAALGLRLGLVDLPSSRRTRAHPIPTTGGIVIFFTVTASLISALRLYGYIAPDVATKLAALFLGGTVIVILGMIDDRVNLRPGVKLTVEFVVAVAMVASGVAIERMRFFGGPAIDLGWMSYPLTVIWLLAFMNAFNLIDGLDGLAGGIAVVAASGLFVVGLMLDNPLLYMMMAGVLGSGIGFLLHNFRRGNVYLGDSGSMLLGFFLAGGAIIGARSDVASKAMLVVGACMAVPAFDVLTTIVRRRRRKTGVMTPDQSHVHHRLIRFGLNPKAAVVVLWGVTVFFGGQMLGLVSPYGLIYILGSYVIAAGVANILLEQRRKNLKTIQSDLRDEMLFLAGVTDPADSCETSTLRQLIVAQIRREALYRRMVREEEGACAGAGQFEPDGVDPTRERVGHRAGGGPSDLPSADEE